MSIAGSDSGGGAGIQADLKTFAAFGVHGTSVITCVTAQNPNAVSRVAPCSTNTIRSQIDAVFESFKPSAVKTGMLLSRSIIRAVANSLSEDKVLLVVDPVMIATSGARLLQPAALKSLVEDLLPLAALVTPNIPEAQVFLGRKIRNVEDMIRAGQELHQRFGCAILVKGGHLDGTKMATDVLFDGRTERLFESSYVRGIRTHGTGCTYSAAITALLALRVPLPQAVTHAKGYISRAIAGTKRVGPIHLLHWNTPEKRAD
jgi:hydroxymethylpyrimidine/phosphomethylpyrimidine kinase